MTCTQAAEPQVQVPETRPTQGLPPDRWTQAECQAPVMWRGFPTGSSEGLGVPHPLEPQFALPGAEQ
jgi:hypothetical protein